MKKIGLLTWHYLDNYGSVLQAFALQKYLKEQGCDVEFINYRKNAKVGTLASFFRYIKYNISYLKKDNNRKSKFYSFRKKYLKESKMFSNHEQLQKEKFHYDKVICGSDQIWSQKRFDKAYYFHFIKDNDVQKYSYAASTIEEYNSEQQNLIEEYLKSFTKISVREKSGVKIIQNFTKSNVEETIDPTLLLNKDDWKKIISKKDYNIIPKKKYILCYFVGEDNKYEKIASVAKNNYNCDEIINIDITGVHNFGTIVKNASPTEFLCLLDNAEAIVTDSYHGVLFSINFNKEFIPLKRFDDEIKDKQNERIYNILNHLKLSERYINTKEEIIKEKIDYKRVNHILYLLRDKSYKFLQKVIQEDYND